MFLPMPTPGSTFEETQRAMLRGNIIPGDAVETDGSIVRDGSSSRFSRVLARELDSSREDRGGATRTPAKGRAAETPQERTTREQGSTSVSQEPGARKEQPTLSAGLGDSTGGEGSIGTQADFGLTENLMVWTGLDFGDLNLVNTDPAGRILPGPVWQDGLPVEIKTRLAADIAAQFTNRSGRQTLTMKLNPEHLGKLDIQFEAKDNHLSVRLVAANPEAETALKENLKELTETIQKQSGRFQQVEVRVDLKTSEDPTDRSRDEKPGQSPHDENQGHSRQGQEQPDQSHGWDDEAQTARSEAPVQGG